MARNDQRNKIGSAGAPASPAVKRGKRMATRIVTSSASDSDLISIRDASSDSYSDLYSDPDTNLDDLSDTNSELPAQRDFDLRSNCESDVESDSEAERIVRNIARFRKEGPAKPRHTSQTTKLWMTESKFWKK
jgi:hypothetical protein